MEICDELLLITRKDVSTIQGCLGCQDNQLYQDLNTLQCSLQCKTNQYPLTYRDPQNNAFLLKYCRGNNFNFNQSDREIYVDGSLNNTAIQLGTITHPYSFIDDIFREIFNKLTEFSSNFTIYIKEGSIITMFSKSMPILILNKNITIKCNLCFNPSMYLNGTVIDYDIRSRYLDGQLDSVEATATKYKFHVYRSNLEFQDIVFIQKQQQNNLFDDSLVNGYTNPYRWVTFTRCQFELVTSIFFTNYGANLKIQTSIIDISQHYVSTFSNFMGCEAYQNQGYSGNLILDQNKFIGQNSITTLSIIEASSYLNFTMIGNTFENTAWRSQTKSFNYEAYEVKCQGQIINYHIDISNNTFVNKESIIESNIYFKIQKTYEPNVYFKFYYNNNRYFNVSQFENSQQLNKQCNKTIILGQNEDFKCRVQ
ncbi:UNKNOWN [Stylonychia lemnae]|uniref:Uncharacterized protein n=1 Tax=Stylonychia lemnae TaxID=5949 RepID=A0A078AR07_STYLE|nr:UNKNOWN [Stylonychia lemnae]|eukprot:CDW84376.1 UNKNOWN [Stylonychia lemnae]